MFPELKQLLRLCAPLAMVAGLLMAAPANAETTRVEYSCNEGIPLIVKFINTNKTSLAIISHDSSPEIVLDIVPSGSGARYSNGDWVLHVKGNTALVGTRGQTDDVCKEVSNHNSNPDQGMDHQARDHFPIQAKSWGGVVRSGPGMQYRKKASLSEGEWIMILERTTVMMNGYPWFKIQYRGGKVGYKWGGILCSVGNNIVEGTFQTCN